MILKKSNVLARLAQIKTLAEETNDSALVSVAIIELLLEYGNDPQIKEAVNAIPF